MPKTNGFRDPPPEINEAQRNARPRYPTWALDTTPTNEPGIIVESAEEPAAANEPRTPEEKEPTDEPAAINKHEMNEESPEKPAAAVNEPGATERISPRAGPEATMVLS